MSSDRNKKLNRMINSNKKRRRRKVIKEKRELEHSSKYYGNLNF